MKLESLREVTFEQHQERWVAVAWERERVPRREEGLAKGLKSRRSLMPPGAEISSVCRV